MAWALEQDIPARPKLVLVSLSNHANHTDGYCWLKAETIASEAACKKRSVYRFVGDLIRNGYVRKAQRRGHDGKQRANDYWLIMNRPPAEWVAVGPVEDENEIEESSAVDDGEAQDVAVPGVRDAPGEMPPPGVVAKHPAVSCGTPGPGDSACTHTDTAEPSKTKSSDARATGYVPRGYQPPPPPPPEPVGSVVGHAGEQIFVYDATPAYEAWATFRAKRNGINRWHMTTTKVVDGKTRYGWYFPSLYPPKAPDNTGTDPPDQSQATRDAINQLGRTG